MVAAYSVKEFWLLLLIVPLKSLFHSDSSGEKFFFDFLSTCFFLMLVYPKCILIKHISDSTVVQMDNR
ncbi:hypothetical protein K501DRAFT_76976 [Backusella circina FSU 941]|nr:hypothetical protein K501DRAFT_76976 [Backusella circina FSU 941]